MTTNASATGAERSTIMDERTATIVRLRGEGLTLAAIGQQVGLSGVRVGRILRGLNGAGPAPPARPSGGSSKRHTCATPGCGRKLSADHCIYSQHTGLRYCWPEEGCWKWSPSKRRRERERAAVAA